MRSFAAAALLLPLALASPLAKRSNNGQLAPLKEEGEPIQDAYIVVLKKDISPAVMALHLGSVEESNGVDVSIYLAYLAPHRITHTLTSRQPLFTFTSEGEKIDESGVTHVYMPAANLSYFGYGTSLMQPNP